MEQLIAKLNADLDSALFRHGCDQGFWELIARDGLTVFARVLAPDGTSYILRLDCTEYGAEPIRGQFVDENRNRELSAWPKGNTAFEQWIKYKDPNPFICWEQDRIAIERCHQDWKAKQSWKKKDNQLVAYLDFIRELLHLPARGYQWKNLVPTN
jgi:hypothetical protein